MDERVVVSDGNSTMDGVTYFGDSGGLEDGKCGITIEPTKESYVGIWSCTLVPKNSTIFTSAVQ